MDCGVCNAMKIGEKIFTWGARTYVMGILNMTPDSFSDGGTNSDVMTAIAHAVRMVEEGADILDIGGESTRPFHENVSAETELARVIPVLNALRGILPHVPLSIDTSKALVAREAVKAGAAFINDVWGFRSDPGMAKVAADAGVACCLMHNWSEALYHDFLDEVLADLSESVRIAMTAGVKRENILLDPGIGFGKTLEQNLILLRHLDQVRALGFPVLLGTSRKSVIGLTLGLPVGDRLEGTLATTALGIAKGADIVRVHDVKENVRVCRMSDAILRGSA